MKTTLLLVAFASPAWAQETDPAPREKPATKSGEWKTSWLARMDLEYDSNIWRLDGDDEERLLDDPPADRISGRFDDMESVEDWISIPSIRFAAKGPGPFGRKLELWAEAELHAYAVNPARSHVRFQVGAEHPVGDLGRLELEATLLPRYFRKNYLADATDLTGSVSASERIYEPGEYLEFELALAYRLRLVEGERFSLDGLATLGLRARDFASPFGERDERAWPLEIGLRAGAWKRVKATLAFRYEPIDSPSQGAVVLLDEPAFTADLNGDGDATDMNARSVQTIDRSRRESGLVLGVEVELAEAVWAVCEWTRTWKDWSSNGTYDLDYRGRSDIQDRIELGVRVQFSKSWEGRLGYEHTVQDTDRPADPATTGETSDYDRDVFTVSALFRW